jgi:hypothetical protein
MCYNKGLNEYKLSSYYAAHLIVLIPLMTMSYKIKIIAVLAGVSSIRGEK